MTKLTKDTNLDGTDVINIETEEGLFYMYLSSDLNIYFDYSNSDIDDKKEYSFKIVNDNSFVYKSFNDLYDAFMSEKPYKYSDNLYNPKYVYPLSDCKINPVDDKGRISIHNEQEDIEVASKLLIEKNDDDYIVTFKKGLNMIPGNDTCKVCIKNGGSSYDPYNLPFVIMYNSLREHDFELDEVEKGISRTIKR